MLLTDAGLETAIMEDEGLELACFAAFPLLDAEPGREALRRYYAPFLALARDRGAGFVLSSPTWRASPAWGARLGYDAAGIADANRRAIAFLASLRDEVLGPGERDGVILEGQVGPRDDGWDPASAPTAEEAERYHAVQVRALAETACERVGALTLASAAEAIGIVRAGTAVGLPVVVSFTVDPAGRLLDGTSLAEAIAAVDDATDGAAASFMVNCAHPSHIAAGLPDGAAARRIRGVRANASWLGHDEADAAGRRAPSDPADLAVRYVALRDRLPALELLGGCCGTGISHVTAICDAWLAAARAPGATDDRAGDPRSTATTEDVHEEAGR